MFVVMLCLIVALPLFGFAKKDETYLTIHFNVDGIAKQIAITDKLIQPSWWDVESKNKFTNNKTLQQRAKDCLNETDDVITMKKKFPEIYRIVKNIESQIHKEKCDGKVQFNPDAEKKFWVTDQIIGKKLDTQRLCEDIFVALSSGRYADIYTRIADIKPADEDDILNKIVERSRFSTIFADNAPRESNIARALAAFDGLVIEPSAIVSFNKTTGPRTAARGYQEANIILEGEFVPGIGGGVCQASTTLFNAVLLSGLKIVESHSHSLAISYVPLGRDAMVSSRADLKFKNTTDETIFIETQVIDNGPKNTALIKIYGARPNTRYQPRVEIETHNIIEEINGEIPVQMSGYDHENREFWSYEKKTIESGYPTKEAVTYLDEYKNGELVNSIKIRKSKYKGKERVVEFKKKVHQENYAWTV